MKLAIFAVTLLILQASLLTFADLIAEDVIEEGGSGEMTTEESDATSVQPAEPTDAPSAIECYVCGHYENNMKPESECGVDQTTYAKEGCPSGSNCWIYKKTVDTNVTYARGCYSETDCSGKAEEQCSKNGDTELCKKCCSTDLCNSGKLELSSDAPRVGFYLSTLAMAVATFLLL